MKENAVIRHEKDYEKNYAGFDPTSPESYIIFSLMQNIHQEKSLELAGAVQEEMVKANRHFQIFLVSGRSQHISLQSPHRRSFTGIDMNRNKKIGFTVVGDLAPFESYIIFSLMQNIHQEKSLELAGAVQEEMVKATNHKDRGVRQAGTVLKDATMPAILVESGFISNREDEKFLMSQAGQTKIARFPSDATTGPGCPERFTLLFFSTCRL